MYGMSEEQVERSGTDSDSGTFVGYRPRGGRKQTQATHNMFVNNRTGAYFHKRGITPTKEQWQEVWEKMNAMGGAFVGHHGHSIRVPQNAKITAAQFMALVTLQAQRYAGRGKTPTANQVATAQKVIRRKLVAAHSSVAGGEPVETMGVIKGRLLGNQMAGVHPSDSGAFWDRVKSIARSAVPTVLPAAAVAFPVAALTARSVAKSQQKSQKAAAPAAEPAPAAGAPAPAASPSEGSSEPSMQNVSGHDSSGFLWFGNKNNLKATPDAESGTLKLLHEGGAQGFKSFKLPSGWSVDEADHTNIKGDGVMGFLGFGSKTVVPYDHEAGYVILRHQGKKNSQPLVIPDKWKVDDHSNTTISGEDESLLTERKRLISIIQKAEHGDKNARKIIFDPAFKDEISNAFDPQLAALYEPALKGDRNARAEFKKRVLPYLTDKTTTSGADPSKTVPYTVYRAEICRRAKLLCRNGTPTAECMARAQTSVHNEMAKAGVKVSIPGAKPGRATAGPTSSMMRGDDSAKKANQIVNNYLANDAKSKHTLYSNGKQMSINGINDIVSLFEKDSAVSKSGDLKKLANTIVASHGIKVMDDTIFGDLDEMTEIIGLPY